MYVFNKLHLFHRAVFFVFMQLPENIFINAVYILNAFLDIYMYH